MLESHANSIFKDDAISVFIDESSIKIGTGSGVSSDDLVIFVSFRLR